MFTSIPVAKTPRPQSAPPSPKSESAPQAAPPVIVSLGDSITAGTIDGITEQSRQSAMYAKQLADHLKIPFNMPSVGGNGIPPAVFVQGNFDVNNYLKIQKDLTAAVTPIAIYMALIGIPTDKMLHSIYDVKELGARTTESLDTPQHPQSNFAIAGYKLHHLIDVHSVHDFLEQIQQGQEKTDELASEVLDTHAELMNQTDEARGTEVDQAARKNPDLVISWAGANDAMRSVFGGVVDDRTLTPIQDQVWNYWDQEPITNKWVMKHTKEPIMGFYSALLGPNGLTNQLLNKTHGQIIMLDLPDITTIPYLRDVGQPVGKLPFHILAKDGTDVTSRVEQMVIPAKIKGPGEGGRTQFPPGSKIGIAAILGMITSMGEVPTAAALDDHIARVRDTAVFTEFDVLDPEEVGRMSARIHQFNDLIAQAAASNPRIHFINLNQQFNDAQKNGRALKGDGPPVTVTTIFTGNQDARGYEGIFGFDGVHPSQTGHAVVANMVLEKIKTELADDPKFKAYKDVPYIDEKAVFAADPHRLYEHSMVLDASAVENFRRSIC